MILRVLIVVAGLGGAAAFSQFPEFSQQYVQRLGGAVDALAQVVDEFDANAAQNGLSREQALAQITGTSFLDQHGTDMRATFQRYESLKGQLAQMHGAGPFMRAYHAASLDGQLARAAYHNYKPALPLTLEGGIFALLGYLIAAIALTVIIKSIAWPLRWLRRRV